MKIMSLNKALIKASIMAVAGYAGIAAAHTAGGVIDAAGNNASATDFASVYCYNDGEGTPAYLAIQIQDQSAPVPGLFMTMMAAKGNQVKTTSDPVSGDAFYSPAVQLRGGEGTYFITASKTAAGLRRFEVSYHCMTSSGGHTGTDISAIQLE